VSVKVVGALAAVAAVVASGAGVGAGALRTPAAAAAERAPARAALGIVAVEPVSPDAVDVVTVVPPGEGAGMPPAFRVTSEGHGIPATARRAVDGYFEVALALDAGPGAAPGTVTALRAAAVEFVLRLPEGVHVRVLGARSTGGGVPSPVAGVMAATATAAPSIDDVTAFVANIAGRRDAYGALVVFAARGAGGALDSALATTLGTPVGLYTLRVDAARYGARRVFNGGWDETYRDASHLRTAASEIAADFARTWVLHVATHDAGATLAITARNGATLARGVTPMGGVLARSVSATRADTAGKSDGSGTALRDALVALGAAAILVVLLVGARVTATRASRTR
jgi:hypothetical protein